METKPTTSPPQYRPFYRRMFSRRALQFYTFTLVTFGTLLALFHAEEDFRGARAWKKYKQEREAAGESFDVSTVIPKPVPDEENFAMTPCLVPLLDFKPGTQIRRDTNAVKQIEELGKDIPLARARVGTNQLDLDLVELANEIVHAGNKPATAGNKPATQPELTDQKQAAQVILNKVNECSLVLEELRRASRRRYARFNVAYDTPVKPAILLPHLAVVKNCCRLAALRATAELALGQSDQALEDVKLAFYLGESIKTEPVIISELVRQACARIALQPAQMGLRNHQWSDAQLVELEAVLGKVDLIQGAQMSLEGESKLFVNSVFEELKATPNRLKVINTWNVNSGTVGQSANHQFAEFLFFIAVPRGWIELEQVNYHRFYRDNFLIGADAQRHAVYPEVCSRAQKKVEDLHALGVWRAILHHHVMGSFVLPSLTKLFQKTALNQAELNMAAVVCELERYRIAHSQYPDSLAALGSPLTNDPIKGGPLQYRRTVNGFVLYSIGWNEADDGGKIVMSSGKKPYVMASHGDWIWDVPTRW